jgi:hypothetical protein
VSDGPCVHIHTQFPVSNPAAKTCGLSRSAEIHSPHSTKFGAHKYVQPPSAPLADGEDDLLSPEQFQAAYEALLRADPATHLDSVVRLYGERLPHGAIRTLEIAAAALRAAEQDAARLREEAYCDDECGRRAVTLRGQWALCVDCASAWDRIAIDAARKVGGR